MKRIGTLLVFALTVLFASVVSVAAADSCDFDVSGSILGVDNPITVELGPTSTVAPALGPGDTITVRIFNKATCSAGVVGSADAGFLMQAIIVGEDNEGVEFSASLLLAPGGNGQVQFTMPLDCDKDLDGVCANRVKIAGVFTSVKQEIPAMAINISVTPAP